MRDQVQSFFASLPAVVTPFLPPTYPLVVGVSGGPDSLALLHLLANESAHPPQALVVGHLDHGLRPESHSEAEFVADLSARWGIRCIVRTLHVERLAREKGLSLEEAGRVARYQFLAKVATDVGARLVAVGHNADDQVETVLMHFLRGTGLAGLRGMRPVSVFPTAPDLFLLRPLLEISRETIVAYCHEQGLEPRHDLSNMDISFFRNRLRHELLPLLESYNPQIRRRLRHTAEVIAADYELLESLREKAWREVVIDEGDGWVRVDSTRWQALPLSLRRQTLRYAVASLRASLRDISFRAVELARGIADEGEIGAQATLPGNLTLTVEYESWRLEQAEASIPVELPQILGDNPVPLTVPSQTALANGWVLELSLVPASEALADLGAEDPWRVFIDAGVAAGLTLRGRMAGERFEPLGMEGHSVSVADLMINEKVPARLRNAWPIVAGGDRVVWVVGLRLGRHARLTEASEEVVCLSCWRVVDETTSEPVLS
jgi:tRNA(Ile)-lysidine synthase